jgi:DNA-directed RNA polymerase specialized sigma24 family protein
MDKTGTLLKQAVHFGSEAGKTTDPASNQDREAPGTPVQGAVPGGNPNRYTDLNTEERLIQFIRKGDQGAWMALYDAYKPITAYQINFFKSQIKPHQKEDLMDAGLSGLAFAIEDAKNPEIFDFPKERFIKLAAYHVSKAMREHLGLNEKAFSLDAPVGNASNAESTGATFQDFLSETTETEAEASEKEKKLKIILTSLPALNFMEEAVLILAYGLHDRTWRKPEEIAQKLGISDSTVKTYTDSALQKITDRYLYTKGKKKKDHPKTGMPHPILSHRNKFLADIKTIRQLTLKKWNIFTPQQQNVIRMLVLLKLSPEETQKTLKLSNDSFDRNLSDIMSRLRKVYGLEPYNSRSTQDQIVNEARERLNLPALKPEHLKNLSFEEKKVLEYLWVEKLPVAEALRKLDLKTEADLQQHIDTITQKLRNFFRNGILSFKQTLNQPTSTLLEGNVSLSDDHQKAMVWHWASKIEPATPEPITPLSQAETSPLSSDEVEKLKGKLPTALKHLRSNALQQPATEKVKRVKRPFDEPVEDSALCAALLKEGLEGITPELISKTLTFNQRQVLELRLKGWSYSEIAQQLGKTESPVKASCRQAIKQLREAHQQTDLVSRLKRFQLIPETTSVSPQDLALLTMPQQKLLCLYLDNGYGLENFVFRHHQSLEISSASASNTQGIPTALLLKTLGEKLEETLESLPEKQKKYIQFYAANDTSFSEIGRSHQESMTFVSDTIWSGLQNIENKINQPMLEMLLVNEGLHLPSQEEMALLTEVQQKLLYLYLERGYSLEALLDKINDKIKDKMKPSKEIPIEVIRDHFEIALKKLQPRDRQGLLAFCENNFDKAKTATQLKTSVAQLRYIIPPALKEVAESIGTLPLERRLLRRGLAMMGRETLQEMPEFHVQLLEWLIQYPNKLKPSLAILGDTIRGLKTDSLTWPDLCVTELDRVLTHLTDRQALVLQTYFEKGKNCQTTGKALNVSGKTIERTLQLIWNNLEEGLKAQPLFLRLKKQGLEIASSQEVSNVLSPESQKILELYLDKGHSLKGLLAKAQSHGRKQSVSTLTFLNQQLQEALGKTSPYQLQALKLYAQGIQRYEDIAVAIGLDKRYRTRIGSLLEAGLVNIHKYFESPT